jgi:hypothetical protein
MCQADLGPNHPYVYTHFTAFLKGVADWVIEQRTTKGKGIALRKGLASTAIQKASTVFFGVGVYTINKVLFYAGESQAPSFYYAKSSTLLQFLTYKDPCMRQRI